MGTHWKESIARIQKGDWVIGGGTVVATIQAGPVLLTCAHVVNAALGRAPTAVDRPDADAVVSFTLPFSSGGTLYHAHVLEWRAPQPALARVDLPVSDIALLKIREDIPQGIRAATPDRFKVMDLEGRPVCGWGFSKPNGAFAQSRLKGADAGGWLSFAASDDLGTFIEPGFSGAPLLDDNHEIILGMVVARGQGAGRVAYALPTKILWRACPQIASPYKGLRAFEEVDQPFFHGRGVFIDALVDKSRDHPILGLSALSGAGKSSVVKAGLIPRLREEGRHLFLIMRPEKDPWDKLAWGLLALAAPDRKGAVDPKALRELRESLKTPDTAAAAEILRDHARALLAGSHYVDRLLIYVDQFEELFTLAGQGRTRTIEEAGKPEPAKPNFLALMAETAELDGDPKIQWCYSLRADFAGELNPYRTFTDRLGDGEIKLSDMTTQETREAIGEPAKALEVTFECHPETGESLLDRLVEDAGRGSGSLPLLEHVLEKLWERLSDRTLTHAAYDALGGLGGALDRYAEDVAKRHFDGERRALLRRLFFRLVEPGDGEGATRRIMSREELDDDALWQAALTLAEARLVVIRGDEGASITAEVAHEALLIHWTSLRDWTTDSADFLKWASAFRMDRTRWLENDQSDAFLLKGGALTAALTRLEDWSDFLNGKEREFIEASRKDAAREDAEKRKKDRRIKNLGFALAAFLALVTLGAVIGVFIFREQAQQADIDRSIYATAVADQLQERGEYVQAILILRDVLPEKLTEDVKRTKSIALAGLARAFGAKNRDPATLRRHQSLVTSAAFSPDGSRIVTASRDGTAGIWDAATGHEIAQMNGHEGAITSAVFSPDGSRIVTASSDNTARIWDAATGHEIAQMTGHEGSVTSAVFSPDGSQIVTASWDNTARISDAATGHEIVQMTGHKNVVTSAVFSPDGSRIVTASDDTTTRIWDAATGHEIAQMTGHEDWVTSAAFSPDGSRVITASEDGTARLWNVSPVTWSPDGRMTVAPPISQTLLDRVHALYPPGTVELTCEERRSILKEDQCQ